jgi:serine protease AprX
MASPYTDRVASYVESYEGVVHRETKVMPFLVIELPYSAIEPMSFSPHVKKIWYDTKVRTLLNIAVPTTGSAKAHDLGFTGKDVTVAVIDTGISPHPDLSYPENRIVAWNDLVNDRSIPYDDNGHGTHVSGIIAGNGVASRGLYTGMAPEAKLVGVKVLDQDGAGNSSDVISALEWCIENKKTYNIKAINLSLGSAAEEPSSQDPLCRAVSTAWENGLVVCVAAGNDGPDPRTINTPGITTNAITVGNLDDQGSTDLSDDTISDSSSRGPTIDNTMKPDLLAPGTNIMSLRPGGGYRSFSGTSMATPMVTGAVAQIFQKYPDLNPTQIKGMLKKNARNMGLRSTDEGAGGLEINDIFEESKKAGNVKQASLFTMLFGDDSVLNKIFSQKPLRQDLSKEDLTLLKFNPLFLSMLLLLPLALV